MLNDNLVKAVFCDSDLYSQVLEVLEQELLKVANKFEWPPEWLDPSKKDELNVDEWLSRIEEFAAGKSDRVTHISPVGRLSQITTMALLGLSKTIDKNFLEDMALLGIKNLTESTSSHDVAKSLIDVTGAKE